MGMDSVELLQAFETGFKLAIPNEVAEKLCTPRDVIDYIMTRVATTATDQCASQRAFYQLRRWAINRLAKARPEIRPKARLADLLPLETRQQRWQELHSLFGPIAWPALERPNWVVSSIWLLTLAITSSVVASLYLFENISFQTSSLIGLLLLLVLLIAGGLLTRPLRTEFPANFQALGDLAFLVVANNVAPEYASDHRWTRAEVKAKVWQIIMEEIGEIDFHEDSDFINDMNID